MSNRTDIASNPLVYSGLVVSVIYFILCVGSACTCALFRDHSAVLETRGGQLEAVPGTRYQRRTKVTRVEASKIDYYKLNAWCFPPEPGGGVDPDPTKSSCRTLAMCFFVLRVILFIVSWSLFGASATNEFPNFTFAQLSVILPANQALCSIFVLTLLGALIDIIGLANTNIGRDNCFTCKGLGCTAFISERLTYPENRVQRADRLMRESAQQEIKRREIEQRRRHASSQSTEAEIV